MTLLTFVLDADGPNGLERVRVLHLRCDIVIYFYASESNRATKKIAGAQGKRAGKRQLASVYGVGGTRRRDDLKHNTLNQCDVTLYRFTF